MPTLICHAQSTIRNLLPLLLVTFATVARADDLWVAKPLTPEGAFTAGIEGPNSDAAGNVFVVNYARQGTIARVTPAGQAEVFVDLQMGPTGKKSVGNGIVFDRAGMMYVADYVNHNVLKIDPRTRQTSVFAHEANFHQPNDLAIAPDDTIYCSDPDWAKSGGQIWRVDRAGKVTRVAEQLGTTNGIEVSPDGKTLYVNESQQRGVWAFPILADGKLGERKLIKQFPDHGFDGMRCDVDGNLYITRYGEGTVVKMTPTGEILQKIDVLGAAPSNLCFGGPDGRTVFVTEVKKTRLVAFRVDRPGLVWQRWQDQDKASKVLKSLSFFQKNNLGTELPVKTKSANGRYSLALNNTGPRLLELSSQQLIDPPLVETTKRQQVLSWSFCNEQNWIAIGGGWVGGDRHNVGFIRIFDLADRRKLKLCHGDQGKFGAVRKIRIAADDRSVFFEADNYSVDGK